MTKYFPIINVEYSFPLVSGWYTLYDTQSTYTPLTIDSGAKKMIQIGDSASLTKTFTESDVHTFAKISGDHNPIHVDAEFAATTRFGRQLVHGLLTAGMISAVLGMQLPGPGCIYLKQELNFRAPVFFGDTITATVTVIKVREDKPIITLKTICTNQEGAEVIDGEALLMVPK